GPLAHLDLALRPVVDDRDPRPSAAPPAPGRRLRDQQGRAPDPRPRQPALRRCAREADGPRLHRQHRPRGEHAAVREPPAARVRVDRGPGVHPVAPGRPGRPAPPRLTPTASPPTLLIALVTARRAI